MNEIPTDPRWVVQIVVRGVPFSEVNAIRLVAGYRALIVGLARAEAWPDVAIEVGDLEACVWTTERQLASVARTLESAAEVVAVRTTTMAT